MRQKISILISTLIFFSCGTGPWFMNKKVYQTFKENIYSSPSGSIRTDGYYLQVGELHPRDSYRDVIIFYDNGYTTSFRLDEDKLENEIINKIIQNKDIIFVDLDWWKVHNDSLIIEHYGETKKDMLTSNYYERGRIINDTMIELKYDDSPYLPVKFRFIKTNSLPKVTNKGRYLKKNWYNDGLNNNRKNTANKD